MLLVFIIKFDRLKMSFKRALLQFNLALKKEVKDLVSFCSYETSLIDLKTAIFQLSTVMEETPDNTSNWFMRIVNRLK